MAELGFLAFDAAPYYDEALHAADRRRILRDDAPGLAERRPAPPARP